MDSLGFFDSKGHVKRAGDPLDLLAEPEFQEFIDRACYKSWFIAGHTRAATHGAVTNCNAPPLPLWPIHRHAQWGGVDSEGPQVSSGFRNI